MHIYMYNITTWLCTDKYIKQVCSTIQKSLAFSFFLSFCLSTSLIFFLSLYHSKGLLIKTILHWYVNKNIKDSPHTCNKIKYNLYTIIWNNQKNLTYTRRQGLKCFSTCEISDQVDLSRVPSKKKIKKNLNLIFTFTFCFIHVHTEHNQHNKKNQASQNKSFSIVKMHQKHLVCSKIENKRLCTRLSESY